MASKAHSAQSFSEISFGLAAAYGFSRAAGVCPSARRPAIPAFVAGAGVSNSSGGAEKRRPIGDCRWADSRRAYTAVKAIALVKVFERLKNPDPGCSKDLRYETREN
jgi:hypothetical protein